MSKIFCQLNILETPESMFNQIVIGAKTESMKCKIQSIKRKVYPSPFWSKTLKAAFTSSMEFSFSFIFLRIILRNSSNSILPKFVNIFKFLTKNSNDLTGPVFIRFCHHFLEIVLWCLKTQGSHNCGKFLKKQISRSYVSIVTLGTDIIRSIAWR